MSKTVLVQGFFYKDETQKSRILECQEVGKKYEYKTPSEFIKAVCSLYRDGGYNYEITNVVIG